MNETTPHKLRWALALGCVMAILFASTSAFADDDPTRGIFEFKLGPYNPQVDAAFESDGPYGQFFGDRTMLYGELAFERNLWQKFGTFAVGGHLGYGRVSAPVLDQDGNIIDGEERSSLRIIPLRASAIYRYDYSARHHNIPLVPVAKLGLNYYLWRVVDAGSDTAVGADGSQGSGGMLGWQATLGLHFDLGVLDPRREASMNINWGISTTYLFAEYTWSRTGMFNDTINLSANHWAIGLAFEF